MSPIWDEMDEDEGCDSCGEPSEIRIGQNYDYALRQCLECAFELGKHLVKSECKKIETQPQ